MPGTIVTEGPINFIQAQPGVDAGQSAAAAFHLPRNHPGGRRNPLRCVANGMMMPIQRLQKEESISTLKLRDSV